MASAQSFVRGVLLALVCGGGLDCRSPTLAAMPVDASETARSPAVSRTPQKTVIILHSYSPGLPWTDHLDRGLRAGLEESRYDLDVRVEFMDAKRYPGDAWQTGLATFLTEKYAGLRLDLVIAADDAALEFVMGRGDRIFGAAPVVFCGINDAARAREAVRLRMTGVIEVLSDEPMIELALRLYPGRTRLLVIGDSTDVAHAMLGQFREIAPRHPTLAFQFLDGHDVPFETILQTVQDAGADSLVFASAFTRDSTGRVYRKDEANALLAADLRSQAGWPGRRRREPAAQRRRQAPHGRHRCSANRRRCPAPSGQRDRQPARQLLWALRPADLGRGSLHPGANHGHRRPRRQCPAAQTSRTSHQAAGRRLAGREPEHGGDQRPTSSSL